MTRSVEAAGDTANSPVSELQHATDTEAPMVPRSALAAAGLELAAWHTAFPYGSAADARARKELLHAVACDTSRLSAFLLTCDFEDLDRAVFCATVKRIHDLADAAICADDEGEPLREVEAKVYPWAKDSGVVL